MEVSSLFEDLSYIGSLGVIVHGYDGLSMMLEDSYVDAPLQAPLSPDYVPGPEEPKQAPPPSYFVPKPVYVEFMPPEDDVLPAEEQPLLTAVLAIADSLGYITESDPEEDPEEDDEDPEEELADYPTDRDEMIDEEEESSKVDVDDEGGGSRRRLAPVDSVPPPACRTTARISIQDQTPIPFLDTPSGYHHCYLYLTTTITTFAFPSTDCTQKRLYITLGPRFEVGESSSTPTARPTGEFRRDYGFVATLDNEIRRNLKRDVGYGITDTLDEIVEDMHGTPIATNVAELSQRMTDFVMTIRQDTDEIYGRLNDTQDDRSLMSGQLNMLCGDRRAHARTARFMKSEARLSREPCVHSMDTSDTARYEVRALRTTVLAQLTKIEDLWATDRRRQTQLTEALTLLRTLQTQMAALQIITEYLVNISKRRAFWSLNEDILKITILKTNTPYPSRKIRRIRACTHQRPQRNKAQYAVSRETQYAVFKIWNEYNILEDIKRGPYSKKSPIRRDLDNSTSNVLIPLDSWTSGLLVYKLPLSGRCKGYQGEFEKIKDVKSKMFRLIYGTSLEVFNNKVSRLCRMDDDSKHEADDDMGYDPSDVAFTKCLGSKIFNYKKMDHYTMKALWIYWIKGDDEVELTNEEYSDNEDEVAKVFRIDTNLFDFETPMSKEFKELNYLLQIDPDLLTKDIEGFKTYEDYKNDWIYEWNKDVPWFDEKSWTNTGVWTKPTPVKHTCKPVNYKTRYYEWYEALEESELKDDALRNKAIMERFIKDDNDESHIENEELCEVHKLPVCNIRRYMKIKYSFNNDEEYVVVKEDEYDDPTITREEACRAYQEIFGNGPRTLCEDIAKISRKRLKPGKHEHGKRKEHRKEPAEWEKCYQKSRMINSSQPKVKRHTLIGGDPRKNDTVDMKEAQGNRAYTFEINLPMIEGMKGRD
ncbi:hypothetical protein Tco_0427821 [Tanacetum coccineum]